MKNIHSKKNPGCLRPWGFVMIFRGPTTWRFRVSARQPTGRTVPKPPHLPDVVTKTQQNGVEKNGWNVCLACDVLQKIFVLFFWYEYIYILYYICIYIIFVYILYLYIYMTGSHEASCMHALLKLMERFLSYSTVLVQALQTNWFGLGCPWHCVRADIQKVKLAKILTHKLYSTVALTYGSRNAH